MQKANNLAHQYLQKEPLAHSVSKPVPSANKVFTREYEEFIEAVFVRLNSCYLHGFSSAFPTANLLKAAKREWGLALQKFDAEDIDYALNVMRDYHKEFPPKLGRFVDLCKLNRQYESNLKIEHAPVVEKASAAVGQSAMSKIKQWL